jgi:hypothetical protein
MAGVAALGGKAGFIGQVADDQLGEIFTHDIRALGVEFLTPPKSGGEPTGRCLIIVTPDAQRTMNTFRGAAHELTSKALDPDQIGGSAILYLEAYLWRSQGPRAAMDEAMAIAHEAGRKVAFTLSDTFCIDRHRDGFNALIDGGRIDILFANEAEIQALAGVPHLETAIAAVRGKVIDEDASRNSDDAARGACPHVVTPNARHVVDPQGRARDNHSGWVDETLHSTRPHECSRDFACRIDGYHGAIVVLGVTDQRDVDLPVMEERALGHRKMRCRGCRHQGQPSRPEYEDDPMDRHFSPFRRCAGCYDPDA